MNVDGMMEFGNPHVGIIIVIIDSDKNHQGLMDET